MTDGSSSARRTFVAVVTTAVASAGAAGSVAWAAATTAHPTAAQPASRGNADVQARVVRAQAQLAALRRDLSRWSRALATLPRAHAPALGPVPSVSSGSVGAPAASVPAPVIQYAPAAPAPTTHTTTGASGATH